MTALLSMNEVIRAAIEAGLADVRVSMPAKVLVFHSESPQRVDVQPCLSDTSIYQGSETIHMLPAIFDVPAQFVGGGGMAITHPIQPGDPCYLIFSDRSLDSWLDSGEVGAPPALHGHHLSDAVAIFGVRSRKDALQVFDNTKITLGLVSGVAHAVALADKVQAQLNKIETILRTKNVVSGSPVDVTVLPSTLSDVSSAVVQTRE
jgi:hypothetical protein